MLLFLLADSLHLGKKARAQPNLSWTSKYVILQLYEMHFSTHKPEIKDFEIHRDEDLERMPVAGDSN